MQSSTSPSPSSQARNAWCLGRSGRRKTASSSRHRSGSTWHLLDMNDPGSCSGQGRVDELSGEDGCERGQQRDTLLVQRREVDVATNVAKSRREVPLELRIPRAARRHNQRYEQELAPAHWVVLERQERPRDRGGPDGTTASPAPVSPATSGADTV